LSNNILAKRNSSIFLGTLLVLGTIATILPSAQAQQYYEESYGSEYPSYKDNYDYKSKDSSSTIVKKIKCNNINDNLNNVDVNSGLRNGNDVLDEAQTRDKEDLATTAANGWESNERNGYKQNGNDFRFVCINNNDNENNIVVVNETTPIPPTPPDPTIACEECFTENENLTPVQLEAINRVLAEIGPLTVTFFEEQISVNDLAALCTYLTLSSSEEDLNNSVFQLIGTANSAFLDPSEIIEEPVAEEIVQCIIEALNSEG
jgi:hypothetical protein